MKRACVSKSGRDGAGRWARPVVGVVAGLMLVGTAAGQGISPGTAPGSAPRGTVTSSKLEAAKTDVKQDFSAGWQVFGIALLLAGLVVVANVIPTKRGHQD